MPAIRRSTVHHGRWDAILDGRSWWGWQGHEASGDIVTVVRKQKNLAFSWCSPFSPFDYNQGSPASDRTFLVCRDK